MMCVTTLLQEPCTEIVEIRREITYIRQIIAFQERNWNNLFLFGLFGFVRKSTSSSFALFDSFFFFKYSRNYTSLSTNRSIPRHSGGPNTFTFLFIIFFLLLLLLPLELSWKWLNWSRNRNLGRPRMNGQIRVSASPWSFRFIFKVNRFVHIIKKKTFVSPLIIHLNVYTLIFYTQTLRNRIRNYRRA